MEHEDIVRIEPKMIGKSMLIAVIITLIVAVIVMGSAMANEKENAAANIDLTCLTDAEIITLSEQVNKEIVDRHIEKTANLEKGVYFVGEDLPAGKYIYTDLATDTRSLNMVIYVLNEKGIRDQLRYEPLHAPKDDGQPNSFYITLHEGEYLSADYPFSLTVCPGVLFK